MKILHTADWHLGKKLHKYDLAEDHQLFINWLVAFIKEKGVEVLLISGDVFDLANPSSEARQLYYDALVRINRTGCKTIVTGGNHDSPAVLNAPKEVLKALNIEVFGNMQEPQSVLLPLPNANQTELVVAAVPYLRDSDLRHFNEGESYSDRIEAVREGIARTYKEVGLAAKAHYPNIPVLAMGHLFAAGASGSDSERDIQIGNEAAFEANAFGDYFRYVALGHIHKPQRVNGQVPIYYSGSPLAFSFGERKDHKRILLLDTENGFEPESIELPVFRELKRLSGSLAEVREKLGKLQSKGQLNTLLELEVQEAQYNPESIYALDRLVFEFDAPGFEIVKHRIAFASQLAGTAELYTINENLEDLQPKEVFEQRLRADDLDEESKQLLQEAFAEILLTVQEQAGV